MGISRRTGLMALVGGIFGGPSAAKAAMQGSTKWIPPPPGYGYGEAKSQLQADDPISALAKRAEHREQLLKQAAGDFPPYLQKELEENGKIKDYKVRLKSVSESYKEIMIANNAKEKSKNYWIEEAKQSLLVVFGIKL